MDPIPIAVIGLHFGRALCDWLKKSDAAPYVRLVAVCDREAPKAEQAARELGVRCFTDLAALLADPTIPAVGLYTGPNGRAALLERCLAAGKHVMTTKPFERDAAAAARVLASARRQQRVLHLNSPSPRPPDLELIRTWMREFDLGRPVAARGEVWASYREQPDGSWYDDPAACPLPPIYRLGIYVINDLIALLGRPAALSAQATRLFTGRPTPDHAQLGIRFAGGELAQLFASFCIGDGDPYRNGLVLHCERGTIYRNIGAEREGACDLRVVRWHDGKREVAARATLPALSGDYDWALFQRAVHGEAIHSDPITVVGGIQVVSAMAEAAASGREVDLPAVD
jgi:predicted dehydrogenase